MSQKYVWLVTGTSSGLGNALLHLLLREGHSVVATTRKPDVLLAELQGKYDAETLKRALAVKLDLSKPEEVSEMFTKAVEKFGRVDIVVNNAGYTTVAEVETLPLEAAREQFDVMFWGPAYICREAVRVFREVNPPGAGGHILNISSAGGYSSQPTIAYYNAAKHALEGYTESLRKEMPAEWNIQATIIEPGGFNTEWRGENMQILPPHPAYDKDHFPTKQYRSMLGAIPFIGSPERAAKAFLSVVEKRQELPLRVQFGTDSLTVIRHTAMKTISDGEKWEYISHSTNIDGIDTKEYMKNLMAALG